MSMENTQDIKKEILDRRLARMESEGPEMGHPVPPERTQPLVPFLRANGVICEVKRKSPSKGDINPGLDACVQAGLYRSAGIKTISVLTEEERFGGSLKDLMDIKKAYPDLCVLRKDFLATPQDIEVSFRAGADAVLLIASLLNAELLEQLYFQARALGMAVLIEVHDAADVDKARGFKPRFTGINCRDLGNFRIDRAIPLGVRPLIDWHSRVIYESGIFTLDQAKWAGSNGFQGILVGEGAVRNPGLAHELAKGFTPQALPGFWQRLYHSGAGSPRVRPLVKICGLCRKQDVIVADDLGAEILGFVLAPSPRQTNQAFLRSLGGTRGLKVGVVVLEANEAIPEWIQELLAEGSLDGLQFHGRETPDFMGSMESLGYKALCPSGPGELEPWAGSLRLLTDGFLPGQTGGTGKVVSPAILESAGKYRPIWLAGGLTPGNITQMVKTYSPELVDVSSGLESSPGRKDPLKMNEFFKELERESL